MKKGFTLILLLVLLAILLIGGVLIYHSFRKEQQISLKNLTPSETQSVADQEDFASENLEFSVTVPSSYEIDEGLTYVDLSTNEGNISIARTAHEFNTINEYLNYSDGLNDLKLVEILKELEVDDLPAVLREEVRGGAEYRIYYIYTDDWVYALSADVESLYHDLDQIAQSFRYVPSI